MQLHTSIWSSFVFAKSSISLTPLQQSSEGFAFEFDEFLFSKNSAQGLKSITTVSHLIEFDESDKLSLWKLASEIDDDDDGSIIIISTSNSAIAKNEELLGICIVEKQRNIMKEGIREIEIRTTLF